MILILIYDIDDIENRSLGIFKLLPMWWLWDFK